MINLRNGDQKLTHLILPECWKVSDSLRFLQANKFNIKTTIEAMIKHLKWKDTYLPIDLTDHTKTIINLGFIYFHGRDHRFRPILIVNLNVYLENKNKFSTLDWERAVIYIFEYGILNLMIPGKVENWVVICDVGKLNLLSIPTDFKNFILSLSNNYPNRLALLYIFGLGVFVNILWSMIKPVLDKIIIKKVKIIGSNKKEIFQHIHPSQVEKKFGGEAEDAQDMFFPPVMPSNKYLLGTENENEILISEQAFHQINNIEHENENETPTPTPIINNSYIVNEYKYEPQQKLSNSKTMALDENNKENISNNITSVNFNGENNYYKDNNFHQELNVQRIFIPLLKSSKAINVFSDSSPRHKKFSDNLSNVNSQFYKIINPQSNIIENNVNNKQSTFSYSKFSNLEVNSNSFEITHTPKDMQIDNNRAIFNCGISDNCNIL